VTKQVERKEKETVTTIPLCSLKFSSLDFDDTARNFWGGGRRGVGAKENLGARLEKKCFFPPNLL